MTEGIGLAKIPAKTLAEQVHSAIRLSILAESFQGGQTLCIEDLATELGVSTTPVREALARLAADGLVSLERNRKPVIATISVDETVQIYMLRRLLEPYYTQLTAYRVSRDPVARSEVRVLRKDVQLFMEALANGNPEDATAIYAEHIDLDHRIQAATLPDNSGDVLGRFAGMINSYVSRLRIFSRDASEPERTKRILTVCREHLQIIDALLEGDAMRIERTTLDHLTHSEERSLLAMRTMSREQESD